MFKKLPLCLVFATFGIVTYGQTIVSTSPENKNVVLEEFTGIHCQFCPDGHARAKAIQDAHPDDVSLINIHQGGYAQPGSGEPDFRTPYGDAIVNQSYSGSGFGYPSGTINRHVFPGRSMASGGGTAMGRGEWAISATETLAVSSDVNVAVEASIDVQTNILTVHVESYYTSDSPESTNLLNVALLQNNTKGPQTGANMGDQYVHMHRLVELITGQWGETINTTTTGSFVDKTYTYPIPADYNGVPTELADMEVVAYVTNSHQEVASGNRTFPTYTGLDNANDAYVRSIADIDPTCGDMLAPSVDIQNLGSEPITSLAITYSINGDANTYNWTGNILSLNTETIDLPAASFNLEENNTLEISVPNDDVNANNSSSTTFEQAISGSGTVKMRLQTDQYGNECTWNLKNNAGEVLYSGGPYTNGQSNTVELTFELPADCYTFNLMDSYGDGGGPCKLTDANGVVVFSTPANFGSGASGQFSSDGVLGITNVDFQNISIYPNPASTVLNISNAENSNVQVYNILGQLLLSKTNIALNETLNVESFETGTYLIKISKDNQVTTKRFVVSK